jgi:hypothetical protein
MTSKKAASVSWVDIGCPTCGAGESQGCLVFGRGTIMKIKMYPHKRRVREAEAQNIRSSEAGKSE